MREDTTKKQKKWLLPVIIAAAVLVVVGVLLAIFLKPQGPVEETGTQSKLYWNVDREENLDPETGMSIRKPGDDGLYTIRFAVDGEQVEYKCADKKLVNNIDFMKLMGLVFDADGMIVEALDPETFVTEMAEEYFVRSFDGTNLVLNSSMAMNGMAMTLKLTENTGIYDVSSDAAVVGASGTVDTLDMVTIYGTEEGEVTHVYRLQAAVKAEVYHRLSRMYDKVNKKSSRVPDENGVYTIEFAYKGKQVALKCKDKELVNEIDYAYDAGAQMGLVFDDEGYIIDRVDAAEAIKGQLLYKKMTVTEVDGDMFSVESKYYANTDLGETDTLYLSEDCEIYMLEADCEAHFIGEATDHLKVGDRCYIYADLEGNPKMIFVERRKVESPMYYNISTMYDSTAKQTTRVPENGCYVYQMAVGGKQVTLKTKDKEIANRIDGMSVPIMGLKLKGNIIEAVYGNGCVSGVGSNANRFITEVMGGIVRMVSRDDWESGGNYLLAPNVEIYDVTNNCNVPVGSVTEIRPFDWLTAAILNEDNQITHMYIKQRYIEDGKLVYHINQQYDSTTQETKRVPNAEGYYVFDMLSEGKVITIKTKDKSVATWIDKNKYPVTVTLKGDVIKGVYSGASSVKGGTTWRVTYQGIDEGRLVEYTTTTNPETIKGKVSLPKDCTVYNYAPVYEKYRGEKTTPRKGENIYAIYSREDYGIRKMFVYSGREVDTPLYWHVNRRWNSTTQETKRVPDENGWYIYELAVDGQVKTFKTKDKAIANKADARGSAFSLILDGDIIQDVITYPYTVDVQGTAAGGYTVTAIDGNTVTFKNLTAGLETTGDEQKLTLLKNCKIYNVSSYAQKFGAAEKLNLGDKVTCYTDNDGKVAYVYITAKNTRAAGIISYCAHCDEEVVWEPFLGTVKTADTHYYLPADRSGSQINLGYTAAEMAQDANKKPYEMILDLNGKNLISTAYRAFLVYSGTLTIMDSVGTGTMKAGVMEGYTGGLIRTSGSGITINIYGGKLYADETSAPQSRGGLFYGSNYTLNIYGGTISGGVTAATESETKPGGGNIYINKGALNIYGGTIEGGTAIKNDNGTGRGGSVFAVGTNINIYGGTIKGGETAGSGGCFNIDGGEFKMTGGVIEGGTAAGVGGSIYATNGKLELAGGTITGDIALSATAQVTLSGAPVVSGKLTLPENFKVTLGEMTEGASVKISANGVFTNPVEDAAAYKEFFLGMRPLDVIAPTADNKALQYVPYVLDGNAINNEPLVFDEGTTDAVCPVCGEKVTWTALTNDAAKTFEDGEHYYLAETVTYTAAAGENFISGPATDRTACLHLNGNDLISEASPAISGSGGTLNVMGRGNVKGYLKSGDKGGAVSMNASYANGVVNVYGGTYSLVGDSKAQVIAVNDNGGEINLYKAVTVQPCGSRCIRMGTAKLRNSSLGIYGATINGNVVIAAEEDPSKYTSTVILDGVNITGNVTVSNTGSTTIAGNLVIGGTLDVTEGSLLTVGELTVAEPIRVNATGIFTAPADNAADYQASFVAANGVDSVDLTDDGKSLCIGAYIPLPPAGDVKFCEACQAEVVWTNLDQAAFEELTEDSDAMKQLTTGHYCLKGSITTNKKRTLVIPSGNTVCIDLNGNNIGNTGSSSCGTLVSAGTLNVMGQGTVTCANAAKESVTSGAVVAYGGTVTLYGGTYTASNGYAALNTNTSGSLTVHAGVEVTKGYLVQMSGNNTLNILGGTFGTTFRVKGVTSYIRITGGSFTADPSAYVPTGYEATKSGNTWTVAQKNA